MVALGYIRLSRESQADGDTFDNHRARLESVPCDLIFSDLESGWKGRSGDSADRKGFQELIQAAKDLRERGLPVEIYVGRIDRWGRSAVTNVTIIEELEGAGCQIFSLDTGRASTKTAGDWLNLSQQSVIAEYYSRLLSDNISNAFQRKREMNKPVAGRPPLGYKLSADKSRYELDDQPYKSSGSSGYEVAVALVEMYCSGKSSRDCARFGARKFGCTFQGNSFLRWIRNPSLRGHLWYWDPPRNKAIKAGIPYRQKIIHNQHEAIISPDQWDAIQVRMVDSKTLKGRNVGSIYSIQRLCRCSLCGGVLSRNKHTRRGYTWYNMRCGSIYCHTKAMSCKKIELEVIKAIQERSSDVQAAYSNPPAKERQPELIQLENQREEIQTLYDKSPIEGLALALADIDRQIADLTQTQENSPISQEEIELLAESLANDEAWAELSEDTKRTIFHALVESVVVDLEKKVAAVFLKF